jgi:uncharacterized membrane protein (UPF0127 family)
MGTNARKHRRFWFQLLFLVALCFGSGIAYQPLSQWYQDRDKSDLEILSEQGLTLKRYKVEVVDTPESRARGLMGRQAGELARHQGMFFIFPDASPRSFWMKNTYIALDIIYFDADCKLISLHQNVPPLNELPRPSGGPAQYVLELIAGTSSMDGLAVGQRCKLSRK